MHFVQMTCSSKRSSAVKVRMRGVRYGVDMQSGTVSFSSMCHRGLFTESSRKMCTWRRISFATSPELRASALAGGRVEGELEVEADEDVLVER